MARQRQKERRIVEARTVEQERVREQQKRLEAVELFRNVRNIVVGNPTKKIPNYQYHEILRGLGGDDEVKGYKKVRGWDDFEQIPAEDQKVFIDCAKKWGN
ncbi:hypothetical protein MYX76_07125 [Desulfobacterota bacterium AH_259_B03_O07]|nr:hypothetical protein [Desulfobacterota bacterium AH_259_B03_O07]